MDKRLFPIDRVFFNQEIAPVIKQNRSSSGRKAVISDYTVFCALLYVLRTGIPWRDLPKCYGKWHTVYTRFMRGNRRQLWWQILLHLQNKKQITMNVVMTDSTTIQVHRHGSGGGIMWQKCCRSNDKISPCDDGRRACCRRVFNCWECI